jgi:membrane peptidoglycan carboxypeptidase
MLELFLSKREILQLYLNRVYLSGGIYGVETMSRKMFRKSASQLSLGEAALIAGIIRAPASYSPWTHYDAAPSPQLRGAAANARREEDHRGAGADGAGRAHSDSAVVVGVGRASGLREGIPAAAVP